MGAPKLTSNPLLCVTCGHHKREHGHGHGCQRCPEAHQHRFLSPSQAMGLIDEHPDLQINFEGTEMPPSIELQARLYALDMAVKSYDLITEVEDTPPDGDGRDWIKQTAETYLGFLMARTYSAQ